MDFAFAKNPMPELYGLHIPAGCLFIPLHLGVSRQMFLVDENFHLKLAEIADSAMLRRILTTIFEKNIMKRAIEGISPMSGLSSCRRHLKILKAIENRDIREARKQLASMFKPVNGCSGTNQAAEAIHGRWGSMKAKQLALGPSISAARSACNHVRVIGNAANNDP
jgi:hypothetical protein